MKYLLTIIFILIWVLSFCQSGDIKYSIQKEIRNTKLFNCLSDTNNINHFKEIFVSKDSITKFVDGTSDKKINLNIKHHRKKNIIGYIFTLSAAIACCFLVLLIDPTG